MSKYLSTPGVADKIPSINGPVLKAVPPNSRKGFYLQPWHLNFSENAKCGKFPSNVAMRLHLPSFLNRGFEGDREPLEVRFDQPDLELFSVMYVDGHTKGVCIQAIFGLLAHCVQALGTLAIIRPQAPIVLRLATLPQGCGAS